MVSVQPAQLREPAPILDDRPVGLFVVLGENPADMGPPKAVDPGRMRILDRIRMAVVLAVVSRPPERSLLHGAASQTGEHKLKPPARFIRAMREVAMVAGGESEHAYEVKAGTKHDAQRRGRHEENRQAGQMHKNKRQIFYPRRHGPLIK